MFLECSFELPVCTSLSDTKPLTYRVSDMLVDCKLVCTNHRPSESPHQHKFMQYWINHNATEKKQNSATVALCNVSRYVTKSRDMRESDLVREMFVRTVLLQSADILYDRRCL